MNYLQSQLHSVSRHLVDTIRAHRKESFAARLHRLEDCFRFGSIRVKVKQLIVAVTKLDIADQKFNLEDLY